MLSEMACYGFGMNKTKINAQQSFLWEEFVAFQCFLGLLFCGRSMEWPYKGRSSLIVGFGERAVGLHSDVGQLVGTDVALLRGDEIVDALDLGGIDESALDAGWRHLARKEDEHIAASDEALRACGIEDCARVDAAGHFESDTAWEVRLDVARDDVCGRSLCGENHVDADGAGLLGNSGYGSLDLLAGGHDEVGELVDYDDEVRQESVVVVGVEPSGDEFLVVFLDVPYACFFEEAVSVVHLDVDGEESGLDFVEIGDDGLVAALHLGEIVLVERLVDAELDHFGVDEDKLNLGGVFPIENGRDDGVQTDGLSLSCGTSYEEVGRLGQIEDESLVGDGLADGDRNLGLRLLET